MVQIHADLRAAGADPLRQPHAKILFCMVGTKQSLKDAGGGVHDAVISMLQGFFGDVQSTDSDAQRLLSNRTGGKYQQLPRCS